MTVPKASENSVSHYLANELEKLGVHSVPFSHLETPEGKKEIDILCQHEGFFPCEAKFTENELIDAIAKIQNNYIKYHEILNVKGSFAILHPKELTRPDYFSSIDSKILEVRFKVISIFLPTDKRKNFSVKEGSIKEIAQIIANQILNPPEYIGPSIGYYIQTLRDSARLITQGLRDLAGDEIEKLFGGRQVFQNILQYEEGSYPVEDLRLATSYIIVNQLLFYQILSKKKNLPEIDSSKLRSSSELQEYFNRVLEINYRFIYSYDVVSKVPDLFLGDLKKIISAIQGLNPEKVGGDLLGTIFHDLIPFEVRKIVAAFYTNPLAADMLASLAIESPYVSVVDFAAGSGGLLVSAYHSKKRLIEDFSEEDHRKFLESEIYGVDIMPFAANVAASHLALQSPEYFTNKVNIAIWDSTELKEGDVIPTLAGIDYVLRGQTSLNMFGGDSKIDAKGVVKLGISTPDDIRLPKFDVIIMNPPFTRQEKIPKNYKDVLDSRFEDYKTIISGQMGYHGYFILLADRFAKQDGVIALVLPATILRIKSFEGIRDLIKEQYSVKYLITSIFRSAFSESTRLREILLIAVKKKTNSSYMTKIVTLKKLPENHDDALILADKIKNYSELNDESMIIEKIDYSSFISTKNWFKFIVLNNKDLYSFYQQFEQHPKLIRISESNFKIKRGFELEKGLLSSLIILSNRDNASRQNDIWILNKQTKNSYHALHKSGTVEFKIPKNCVQFALRRASGLNKIIVDDTLDYIITTSWSKGDFRKFQESLGKQFQSKLLDKIKRNVDNRLGNLYIVRRFNISAPNTFALAYYSSILAAPTKLLYSVNLPDSDAIILTSYFNSVFNLLQVLIERVETEGAFLELSEYVLDDFMIPNLSELSESEKILIIENFKNIGNKPLESIYEQLKHGREYRIQLDEIWKTILGIDVDLNSLYRCIIKEINLLKNIMKN